MKYLVIDDALNHKDATNLKNLFESGDVFWKVSQPVPQEFQTEGTSLHQLQFVNTIYANQNWTTSSVIGEAITPLVNRCDTYALLRLKVNLTLRAEILSTHGFHIDLIPPHESALTAVYYFNDNNGWTEFKDGTKIQSKFNRLLVFPAKIEHSGSTHTDVISRIVANINFIPHPENKEFTELTKV